MTAECSKRSSLTGNSSSASHVVLQSFLDCCVLSKTLSGLTIEEGRESFLLEQSKESDLVSGVKAPLPSSNMTPLSSE